MKHCYIIIRLLLITATSAVNAEEWELIGMATIVDGWITPGYVDDSGKQIAPNTCAFEVK